MHCCGRVGAGHLGSCGAARRRTQAPPPAAALGVSRSCGPTPRQSCAQQSTLCLHPPASWPALLRSACCLAPRKVVTSNHWPLCCTLAVLRGSSIVRLNSARIWELLALVAMSMSLPGGRWGAGCSQRPGAGSARHAAGAGCAAGHAAAAASRPSLRAPMGLVLLPLRCPAVAGPAWTSPAVLGRHHAPCMAAPSLARPWPDPGLSPGRPAEEPVAHPAASDKGQAACSPQLLAHLHSRLQQRLLLRRGGRVRQRVTGLRVAATGGGCGCMHPVVCVWGGGGVRAVCARRESHHVSVWAWRVQRALQAANTTRHRQGGGPQARQTHLRRPTCLPAGAPPGRIESHAALQATRSRPCKLLQTPAPSHYKHGAAAR
jgi:hypothetical protein